MADRGRRWGIGIGLGTVWTVVLFLWDRIGDIQQARDLFNDAGATMGFVGAVILSPYFGPAVSIGCLIGYVILRQQRPNATSVNAASNDNAALSTNTLRTISEDKHRESREATQALFDAKARNAPPKIAVSAVGGKNVVVVVENEGRAFTLGLYTRITDATMPIDHRGPNEYLGRKFSSGANEKTYQIATVETYGDVCVLAESNYVIQRWQTHWQNPVSFEVLLKFISKEPNDHTPLIGRWLLKIELDTSQKYLTASVRKLEDSAGDQTS